MDAGKIIVETERLVIREWEPDDWMRFRPLVTDPQVLEYLCSEPWSDERTQEFISKQIEFSNSRGWAGWPVAHKKGCVLIGFFGFGDEITPDVQIGWRFLPEYWGRGLATEAATAMMQYGFDTFHFDRLIAVAHPANLRSISIMKKLGMTFEKPLSYKGIEVVCYATANPVAGRPGTERATTRCATMSSEHDEQRRLIVEQFTKQAVPFAEMPHHNDEDTNRLVMETAGIGSNDTVLDVACGPGLITAAVAKVARHITGIDITPAMIEEARKRQQSMGLNNMDWKVGDVLPLPFPDSSFSAVITRYSFHHFLDPEAVLKEMVRVCQPGGKVAVVDVFTSTPEQGEAYDRMEKLRDPSHTRALLLAELTGMFHDAGLREMKTALYKLDVELERLLVASCTKPDDAQVVRRIFEEDLGANRLGVGANRQDDGIHFAFPIVVMVGKKSGR